MNEPRVLHVCVSERKGTQKHAVARALLITEMGLEGDAHAGPWHRQISLLADEAIDTMRAKGIALAPGAFAENIVTRDVDLDALGVGSRLTLGGAELEITQIGKKCHNDCEIRRIAGDCIMPRLGLFARVLRGGEIAPGAPIVVTAPAPRLVALS